MFPKGRTSQVTIVCTLIMAGILFGMAIQPTEWNIRLVLGIVAVGLLFGGFLALERYGEDEYRRASDLPTRTAPVPWSYPTTAASAEQQ